MFYYVKVEDLIPEGHLLKLVDRHIDCTFMRAKVKHLYRHTGRPSIDPEVLLRMLFIGYLYGIISERRLCEEVKMHIGYRWFVGGKTALKGKPKNADDFQLCFEFN